MKITLTDKDGIEFLVNVCEISSIREKLGGAKITLESGEIIRCKESAIAVYQKILDSKFGGHDNV